jgi:hypothetical protein
MLLILVKDAIKNLRFAKIYYNTLTFLSIYIYRDFKS